MGTTAKTVSNVLNKKGISVLGTVGVVANAASTIGDYKHNRAEGHGKISSAISAGGNALMFEAIGMKGMLGLGLLKSGPDLAVKGILKANSMARSMDQSARNSPFINATFNDSQQAYTMRQAGMQLAQNSKYNLQQALMGNEAASMHRI